MRNVKRPYALLSAGVILVLMGIFFEVMTDYSRMIILMFVNAGAVMVMIAAIHFNKRSKRTSDERTKKIGAYALSWSWFITFVVINLIYWFLQLEIISLTAIQLISIIFPTMLLTGAGLQWYLKRKGDVT